MLETCECHCKFFLCSNPPKRGSHWKKWEKLYLPREERVICFRMIHEINLAHLPKQLWRLFHYPDSLLALVLHGMKKEWPKKKVIEDSRQIEENMLCRFENEAGSYVLDPQVTKLT